MLKLYTEGYINEIAKAIQDRLQVTTRWSVAEMPTAIRKLGIPDPEWRDIGYPRVPSTVEAGFNYALQIKDAWDLSWTYKSFRDDPKLMFFPKVDTSHILSAENMFRGAFSLVYIPNDLDFSKVTSIRSMVDNCDGLPTLVIDTLAEGAERSIDGRSTAAGCENLQHVELDCKYVTTLESAFNGCHNLQYVDLGDTSRVTSFVRTFEDASRLAGFDFTPDWSSLVNGELMLNMVHAWDQDIDWDMPACVNAIKMFQRCGTPNTATPIVPEHEFKIKINFPVVRDLSGFCLEVDYEFKAVTEVELTTSSSLEFLSDAFSGCSKLTKCIITNTSSVGTTSNGAWSGAFAGCSNLTTLSTLNMKHAKHIINTFNGCSKLTSIDVVDDEIGNNMYSIENAFRNCQLLEDLPFLNLGGISSDNSNFTKEAFLNCYSLTDKSLDNILQSCLTVPSSYTGIRTLYWMGIRETYTIGGQTIPGYSVERIEALPHYQDFIDANWTIGYPVT